MIASQERSHKPPSPTGARLGTWAFYGLFSLLVLVRVWLLAGIPKAYVFAPHDDLYFAKAADTLLKGQWMGMYNSMALIKAPFYAFFLAGSALSGLPLFTSENLFYILACLVLYVALRPLVPGRWPRLLIFAVLLFCPASLPTTWNIRVYREFVYLSLSLLVMACALGLLLRIKERLRVCQVWAVGLGLSMGAFLLTREDAAWIYPSLAVIFTACLWLIWKKSPGRKFQRAFILLIPVLLWSLSTGVVSYLNFSNYAFWGFSEQLDPLYNQIINTIGRIETPTFYPYEVVTMDRLREAYKVSPSLSLLRPQLDLAIQGWADSSEQALINGKPAWYVKQFPFPGREYGLSNIFWALRGGISDAGYYSEGHYPQKLYAQIASELTQACDSGRLTCSNTFNLPLIGTIKSEHLHIILHMLMEDGSIFINNQIFGPISFGEDMWTQYTDNSDQFRYFDELTYNPPQPRGFDLQVLEFKSSIFDALLGLYTWSTWLLLLLAGLCLLGLIVRPIWHHPGPTLEGWTALLFLFALLFSRFMMLVIVDVTTIVPAIYYGSSLYLFLYPACIMLIYLSLTQGKPPISAQVSGKNQAGLNKKQRR